MVEGRAEAYPALTSLRLLEAIDRVEDTTMEGVLEATGLNEGKDCTIVDAVLDDIESWGSSAG